MSIAVVIIEGDQTVMKRLVDVLSNSSFCEVTGVAKNRGEAAAEILANRADL